LGISGDELVAGASRARRRRGGRGGGGEGGVGRVVPDVLAAAVCVGARARAGAGGRAGRGAGFFRERVAAGFFRAGGWSEADFETAEAEWARTAADAGANGPDAAFERQWARELVAAAMARVEARYVAEGKAEVFAELRTEALEEGAEAGDAGEAAGMTAGARRVAVFRLRKRFAEALRSVVADTLPEGSDVEAELRELGAGLGGGGGGEA
jgi:hypothetical protein